MESRLDHGRGAQSESRPPSVPAPESRRVRARRASALLALDVDVNAFLPPDTISAGFDNVADAQSVLGDADGRLPARREPHQLARGRRSASAAPSEHDLQGAAHRLADAPRRGRAVRHARRHLGDAHLPGRRRIHLPHAAALDPDRPVVRQHRAGRAARGLDRRRARRGARDQPAHERSGSERHEHHHAADSRQGRHAARVGGVRAALRRGAGRPDAADRPHAGRLADRRGLRHHDAAAPARVRGRAVRSRSPACPRRRAAAASSRCRPTSAAEEAACANEIIRKLATQAYRGPLSRGGPRRPDTSSTRRAARRRRLRVGHPHGAAGDPREPALPVPSRRGAGHRASRAELPHHRSRSRDAAVVLPLGRGSGRRAAEGRAARHAARPGRARRAGQAHARGSEVGRAGDALRVAVAAPAGSREDLSRRAAVPVLRPHARRSAQEGNRAVLRQHRPRGSQHPRPDHRRLHVRQRARRAALRHPERQRRRTSGASRWPTRTAAACSARAASSR